MRCVRASGRRDSQPPGGYGEFVWARGFVLIASMAALTDAASATTPPAPSEEEMAAAEFSDFDRCSGCRGALRKRAIIDGNTNEIVNLLQTGYAVHISSASATTVASHHAPEQIVAFDTRTRKFVTKFETGLPAPAWKRSRTSHPQTRVTASI
jgi:hypothetical protein